MSERTEEFAQRCHRAVLEIKDPVELQDRLREMVEQEFPVAKPVFQSGEQMPMHEFLKRYRGRLCRGVETEFLGRRVTISSTGSSAIFIAIHHSRDPKPLTPNPLPLTGEAEVAG